MNNNLKAVLRGLAVLALTIAAAGLMSAGVYAEQINLDKNGSLTIKFVSPETGEAITESEFTLYKVAELSEDDNILFYTYTGDFYYCTEDLSGSLNQALAVKLAQYAIENNAEGTSKAIGSDGTVKFDDLDLGLYLVIETKASYYYYSAGPFLVALPAYEDDSWVYDVTASPKPQSRYSSETTEATTESRDDGGDGTTEEETEVTTEGTETTTQSPSGGGGGGSDDDEDDPPSSGGGGSSYIIGEPDPDPETTPPNLSTPGTPTSPDDPSDDPDDPGDPDDPDEPDEPVEPGEPDDEIPELPQTGQNNLPVPVLALSGLCLFSAGWKLYFTDREGKE